MVRTCIVCLALLSLTASTLSRQQHPDFSGGWIATKDAPAGLATATSPVFGAKFWIDQKGDRLTLTRPNGDAVVVAVHTLDGAEVRVRVPGGTCLGDTTALRSTAWDADSIVYRILGTIPPAASTMTPSTLRQLLRKTGPDTVVVESMMRLTPQADVVPAGTVYKRTAEPAPAAVNSPSGTPAALTRMSWLAGSWSGSTGTTAYEERWTPANGGSMFATSRTTRNGSVSEFEFLCIAERAGSLVYTAMPNARTPATDFMLTAIDETSATFENPSHDFPKKIRYALKPGGTLDATISGEANQRSTTFSFTRTNRQ